MLTIANAQSKFILAGEHFVVDGAPSVVIPASCFSTQVSLVDQVEQSITASCIFECEQPELSEHRKEYEDLVIDLLHRGARILGIELKGVGLRCLVKSNIPPGQGAGSSSALCQGIAEVLLKHFIANDIHPNYLKWFGTALENDWHGPVSGIDNAAIAYRRPLFYQRNTLTDPIKVPCPLFFVVGTTGARTGKPYEIYRNLRDKSPGQYQKVRRQIEDNANELRDALINGDLYLIGQMMDASQWLMKRMGLSTSKIDEAAEKANSLGAFGSRMTGAGCGGFVIALASIDTAEVIQLAWIDMGLKSVRTLQIGDFAFG